MFEMLTPYFDVYRTFSPYKTSKRGNKPVVLRRRTCPVCGKKLVNLYYLNQADEYICKNCIDTAMKEKEKEDES